MQNFSLIKFVKSPLAIAATLALATLAALPAAASAAQPERFASGRILVSPKAGLPAAEFNKIIKTHGAHASRKLNGLNVYVVSMPAGREQALVQALSRNKHVKFAEVDGVLAMQQTPADPYYGNEWHMTKVQAPAAWDSATGSGITIAVLDGGVHSAHPDLAANIVPGWNFFDNNNNTADVNGHGTKVAGVAAGIGNNAIGVAGAAWNAKIMPMRISDAAGSITYYSVVANSLIWAADRGARVANISYVVSHVATVQSAAQYMRNKGGVVVTSGGNTGTLHAAAETATMIVVAATDAADQRASWSTYGPYIDLSAPGVGIWTTTAGGGYGAVSGTSFSSPLTAGVVALMLSANPALQPSQVDAILTSTADDLGTPGRDDYFGAGRLNAARAVAAAKSAVTVDSQAPAVSITSPGGTVKGIVTVDVAASDNIGVNRVELYVGGVLVASDIAGPYSFSWDSATRADGATTLVAKAYDTAGNVASSTTNITVANTAAAADVTAPVVSIANPVNGSTVSGTVGISVSASDNVAVASVSLYIDGALAATGNASLSYNWNSRKAASGSHSIQAVARDTAGNVIAKTVQVTK